MFQADRLRILDSSRWQPRDGLLGYVEAWKVDDGASSDWYAGGMSDEEISHYLARSGRFSSAPLPSIRLLLCERIGWQPLGFAMSRSSFLAMEEAFGLPEEMLPLIAGNAGTQYWSFQHDDRDKLPTSMVVKCPQMFQLGNLGLALKHCFRTGSTVAFLHGWNIFLEQCHVTGKPIIPHITDFVESVRSTPSLWAHPLLLPTVLLKDHLLRAETFQMMLSGNSLKIERTLGVTQAARLTNTRPGINAEMRELLRDEEARLLLTADLNTATTNLINLSAVLRWDQRYAQFLTSVHRQIHDNLETIPSQAEMQLARLVETLAGLAVHNEGYAVSIQARLQLQLDVLYNLIAQAGNDLNSKIAATSGLDSSAMKTLAFVTILFLPPSLVASILGMSIFDDWPPGSSDGTLSYFWVYWTISIPLTLLVILGWRFWWRRQETYYRRTYLKSYKAE